MIHPLRAMRLGLPLFVLPFIFVYDPALIMEGSTINIVERVLLTLVTTWAITSALESWIYGVGRINLFSRRIILAGGVLVIVPELLASLLGGGVQIAAIGVNLFLKRGKNVANL